MHDPETVQYSDEHKGWDVISEAGLLLHSKAGILFCWKIKILSLTSYGST